MVALWFGSSTLLEHSMAFWSAIAAGSGAPSAEDSLRLEADMRRLETRAATEGDASDLLLLLLGGSAVSTDVDEAALEVGLDQPAQSVERLWISGTNAVEIGMLTPDLIELRPRAVLFLATPWVMYRHIQVEALRLYNAQFAARLFGARGLIQERSAHAAQLLSQQHVLLRQREGLRSMLERNLAPSWSRLMDGQGRLAVVQSAIATAADFSCDSVQIDALVLMGRALRTAGSRLLVVATPVATPWGQDPSLRAEMDRCLAGRARDAAFEYLSHADAPRYERSHFIDQFHLGSAGRALFTRHLITQLGPLARDLQRHSASARHP